MCDYAIQEMNDNSGRSKEMRCKRDTECEVCNHCLRHCPGHNVMNRSVVDNGKVIDIEEVGINQKSFSPGDVETRPAGTVHVLV